MDPLHERLVGVGLRATEADGFVLAGGHAVRAHGFGDRPSNDVDLFTNVDDAASFDAATDSAIAAYRADGLTVRTEARVPCFARLLITDEGGASCVVDLGVDYRQLPASRIDIGPVLSERDAVASKVTAVYRRAEVRDLIDLQAVLDSGRYIAAELLDLGDEREETPLDRGLFAARLRATLRLPDDRFTAYGASPDDILRIRSTMTAWSDRLQTSEALRAASAGVAYPSPYSPAAGLAHGRTARADRGMEGAGR